MYHTLHIHTILHIKYMLYVLTAVGLIGAVHTIHRHVAAVMRRNAIRLVEHVLAAADLTGIAFGRRFWGWKAKRGGNKTRRNTK